MDEAGACDEGAKALGAGEPNGDEPFEEPNSELCPKAGAGLPAVEGDPKALGAFAA